MDWYDIPVRQDAASAAEVASDVIEAPESGFGALVIWCAGPDHTFRGPALDPAERHVTLVTTDAQGVQNRGSRPFSVKDQDAIDSDINAYLLDAGVPPRPPGYRWYLNVRHQAGTAGSFWGQLDNALTEQNPTVRYPIEVRNAIQAVIPQILGT